MYDELNLLEMPEEEMSNLLTEQRTTQQKPGEAVVNIWLKLQHLKYQDNSSSNIIINNTIIVMVQLLWKKIDNSYHTNFITCNVITVMTQTSVN